MLTASRDNTARVWDAGIGKEVHRLQHDGAVTSACFSSDGLRILTASGGYAVRVWDAETGKELLRHQVPNETLCARFFPSGERILTGSWGDARVLDAQTGKRLFKLRNQAPIQNADISPCSTRILTVNRNSALLWDAGTSAVYLRLEHKNEVCSANFCACGERVLTASSDTYIRLWDARTGSLLGTARGSRMSLAGQSGLVSASSRAFFNYRNWSILEKSSLPDCPRCLGKGIVDQADIERLGMRDSCRPGRCQLCAESPAVPASMTFFESEISAIACQKDDGSMVVGLRNGDVVLLVQEEESK